MTRISDFLGVGLNGALGLELVDPEHPSAGVRMPVEGLAATPFGGGHAAAIEALLDVTALVTLLPHLEDGEHAVTHAASFQLIGATPTGSVLEAEAHLDRRTRRTAFLQVVARIDSEVVARAQVTKSVVRPR